MRYPLAVVAVTAVLLGCADAPTATRLLSSSANASASAGTTSMVVPLNGSVFVPCANGGAGEDVDLTGNLHQVITLVTTANGTTTFREQSQPQGVSGIGQVTGDIYRGTGSAQMIQIDGGPAPSEFTFINNFRIIGPGPGNNVLVHENEHLTMDANGNVRADFDNLRVECK